jgi:hypothetical protein
VSNVNTNRVEELLAEILRWTKFAGAREVRAVLTTTLDTDQMKLIYHMSDGRVGSVEIAKVAGTSDRTVRRYWEAWAKQGIVDVLKVRGGDRYKKSFELEDFGIRVPQMAGLTTVNQSDPLLADNSPTKTTSEGTTS